MTLIFVSCGQATEPEKNLGVLLKATIEAMPGFEAYFAETVHDLDTLGRNIFEALRRCVGAVIILHDRGTVIGPESEEWGHRSSVWINQELAILAYRQFFEEKNIPVLTFTDPEVILEGAMTSLIVNPAPLGPDQEVASAVTLWLTESQFGAVSDEAFQRKWGQLSEPARRVVAGLLEEGGRRVKETAVRQVVRRLFNIDSNQASEMMRKARLEFINTDLVKLIQNIHSGNELSVHPTWEFSLRREIAKWSAAQGHGIDVA